MLVQNIQALVGSVRNEDQPAVVRDHAHAIVDVVEAILAAAEAGMDQPTSFHTEFTKLVLPAYKSLNKCKGQLESALHDEKSSPTVFSQGLPPLAFQIAREAKGLTAKVEEVMISMHGDGEDFS